MSKRDVLKDPYCCIGCSWRGVFGDLIGADVVRCPSCRSDLIQPLGDQGQTHGNGGREGDTIQ